MKLFVASLLSVLALAPVHALDLDLFATSTIVNAETPAEGDDSDGDCDGSCPLPGTQHGCDGSCPDHDDEDGEGDKDETKQHGCGGDCPDHDDEDGEGDKDETKQHGCGGDCPDHDDEDGEGDKE